MSKSWPPPPDLHSIEELVTNADIEGFIADGSPADEYKPEAEELYALIHSWPTADLTADRLLPVIEAIWSSAFSLGDPALDDRRVKFRELASQIERFFGPGAQP